MSIVGPITDGTLSIESGTYQMDGLDDSTDLIIIITAPDLVDFWIDEGHSSSSSRDSDGAFRL